MRIALCEAEPVFGEKFQTLKGSEFEIAGSAKDGYEALQLAGREPLDVILLDMDLPQTDALRLINSLLMRAPKSAVIVRFGAHKRIEFWNRLVVRTHTALD